MADRYESCVTGSDGKCTRWSHDHHCDDRIDKEFAYTSYRDSCRDPHPSFRECRRPIGHDGKHAAGFGQHRMRWGGSDAT